LEKNINNQSLGKNDGNMNTENNPFSLAITDVIGLIISHLVEERDIIAFMYSCHRNYDEIVRLRFEIYDKLVYGFTCCYLARYKLNPNPSCGRLNDPYIRYRFMWTKPCENLGKDFFKCSQEGAKFTISKGSMEIILNGSPIPTGVTDIKCVNKIIRHFSSQL
jgi:hypothetical protein